MTTSKPTQRDFRSLQEIFQSMERARQTHPLAEGEAALDRRMATQCLCDGESAIYVKVTPQGRRLSICPACDPKLSCQKCQGTGQLRRFNLTTLTDDIVPNACECVQLENRLEMFARAQIPEKYMLAEFGKFELSLLKETQVDKFLRNQEIIYNFCEFAHRYINESHEAQEKHFLVLMGPVGTGKTYLAAAALRRLILEYGHTGRFVDFQFLLSQLRDAYAKRNSEEDILRPLRKAEVLVIDEFGKGRTENEWQMEKLDDLVNSRYNSGKVTIVTTNYLTPEAMRDWQKTLTDEEKKQYMPGVSPQYLQSSTAYLHAETKNSATNESFWHQSLPERIGLRMYDRIVETSIFVDFLGLPSLRKIAWQEFYQRYAAKVKE